MTTYTGTISYVGEQDRFSTYLSAGQRYTVKRYRSIKRASGEEWQHDCIRLEPLNPEFEAWELEDDPGRFRVIGEFVRVLDAPPVPE